MTLATKLLLALLRAPGGIEILHEVAAELDPSVAPEFLAALSDTAGRLFRSGDVAMGECVLRMMNGVRVGS